MVMDLCYNDAQRIQAVQTWRSTGKFPDTLCKLTAARTTGQQTIYRSELYAVVKLCEWFSSACIKSDSAAVIRTFEKCLHAHTFASLEKMEEVDLVYRLWKAVKPGKHVIIKVRAHLAITPNMSDLQIYDVLGNRLADEFAVHTCKYYQPVIARMGDAMFQDITRDKDLLMRYCKFLLQPLQPSRKAKRIL